MDPFCRLVIGIQRALPGAFIALAGFLVSAHAAESHARTIYLVRHGSYRAEQSGDPTVTKELTPLGIAQARLVGSRLRGLPFDFDAITVSPMTRARQTAAVIAAALKPQEPRYEPLLREVTPPTFREDIMREEKPEQLAAAERQLNEAFAKFFVPAEDHDRNELFVCHGNVIRWFACKALGVDPKAWLSFGVAHCSLTVIEITPKGTFKVLAVGDSGHLPPSMVSGLTTAPEPALVAK